MTIADIGRTARRIVKCGKDTLNTPYKEGLTGGIDTGIAIITMGSVNYGTILYIPDGGLTTTPFIRKKTAGTWGNWIEIATGVIDCGIISVAAGGGTATKFSVTFSKKFNQIPSVTATVSTTSPQTHAVSVPSVTKTGFEGYLYREASQQQMVVRWIATEQ